MMNSSTGHKHDGTTAEGPKVLINNLTIASRAQGDIYFDNGTNPTRLAAGTSGQVLKTQGAAADPIWSGSGAATNVTTSEATIISTSTAEETAISVSVPANTIGTNGLLRFRLHGLYTNNSAGAATVTTKLKYGSTTLGTTGAVSIANSASAHVLECIGTIKGDGTTSSQEGSLIIRFVRVNSTGTAESVGSCTGTAAEDSTGALNFVITMQSDTSDGNISFVRKDFILEDFASS